MTRSANIQRGLWLCVAMLTLLAIATQAMAQFGTGDYQGVRWDAQLRCWVDIHGRQVYGVPWNQILLKKRGPGSKDTTVARTGLDVAGPPVVALMLELPEDVLNKDDGGAVSGWTTATLPRVMVLKDDPSFADLPTTSVGMVQLTPMENPYFDAVVGRPAIGPTPDDYDKIIGGLNQVIQNAGGLSDLKKKELDEIIRKARQKILEATKNDPPVPTPPTEEESNARLLREFNKAWFGVSKTVGSEVTFASDPTIDLSTLIAAMQRTVNRAVAPDIHQSNPLNTLMAPAAPGRGVFSLGPVTLGDKTQWYPYPSGGTVTDGFLRPDGATILRYRDGNVEWIGPDGTQVRSEGKGRKRVVLPDGAVGWKDDNKQVYFFESANWEMMIKALNANEGNSSHFWVFYSSLPDVKYELKVTDTVSDSIKTYRNPLGFAAPAVVDTEAFATIP